MSEQPRAAGPARARRCARRGGTAERQRGGAAVGRHAPRRRGLTRRRTVLPQPTHSAVSHARITAAQPRAAVPGPLRADNARPIIGRSTSMSTTHHHARRRVVCLVASLLSALALTAPAASAHDGWPAHQMGALQCSPGMVVIEDAVPHRLVLRRQPRELRAGRVVARSVPLERERVGPLGRQRAVVPGAHDAAARVHVALARPLAAAEQRRRRRRQAVPGPAAGPLHDQALRQVAADVRRPGRARALARRVLPDLTRARHRVSPVAGGSPALPPAAAVFGTAVHRASTAHAQRALTCCRHSLRQPVGGKTKEGRDAQDPPARHERHVERGRPVRRRDRRPHRHVRAVCAGRGDHEGRPDRRSAYRPGQRADAPTAGSGRPAPTAGKKIPPVTAGFRFPAIETPVLASRRNGLAVG